MTTEQTPSVEEDEKKKEKKLQQPKEKKWLEKDLEEERRGAPLRAPGDVPLSQTTPLTHSSFISGSDLFSSAGNTKRLRPSVATNPKPQS